MTQIALAECKRLTPVILLAATVLSALVLFPVAAKAGQAETLAMDELSSDRFQMKREDDLIIRMDKNSGAISTCLIKGNSVVCRLAADERDAFEEEIASLQLRLEALEGKSEAGDFKAKQKPDAKSDGNLEAEKKSDDSLDKELDKVVEMSSKVLRRFFTVMKDLREDLQQ